MKGMARSIDVTIKNYRRFTDARPARLRLGGFVGLVGINNAGKSSLLRFFYEFRHLFAVAGNLQGLHNLVTGGNNVFNYQGLSDQTEVFSNSNGRDLTIEISLPEVDANTKPPVLQTIRLVINRGTNAARAELDPPGYLPNTRLDGTVVQEHDPATGAVRRQIDIGPMAEGMALLANTLYLPAFRNAINAGASAYYDIQVGQAFIQQWRTWKTGNSKAANEAVNRLTNDIRNLFGFGQLEINASEDGQTLQVFVENKSYRLSELGSGLAQFVLVLGNAATRRPAFILVDEPELNLHPALQLDFLTTVASYATQGLCFATHSMGLARASADRVYVVRPEGQSESRVSELSGMPRLAEFLGEMSFFGYREVGFNRVLGVEGATDVKTFQQLLRLSGKDHSVLVFPLGGAGLINATSEEQLAELTRISQDIVVIIDSERTGPDAALPPDRQAFLEICGKLGIRSHALDRRAIENYFSGRAVQAVMGEKYQALEPYEQLKAADPAWAKQDNWRIARETSWGEIENSDLGQFLAGF
jgi:predicted ATPase